tara:strand:+ start:605 stop:916 length:312 start_codon:yes stop_codon:yes gene_type:complete
MSKYSNGKYARFISDRSGLEFPYSERIEEWTGAIVHYSEYEPKQPQLEPVKAPFEPQALYQPRPDVLQEMIIIIAESIFGDKGITTAGYHGIALIGEVEIVTS